jgi:hypothetical protein
MSLEFCLFEKTADKKSEEIQKSEENVRNIFETIHHSWYNKTSHVIRKDRKILHCKILKMIIMANHQVGVELIFKENNKKLRKVVSPIFIATMRILWLNRDIVSEDDDEDDFENNEQTIDQKLPDLRLLPKIGIILSREQQKPLEYTLKQTHLILSLI